MALSGRKWKELLDRQRDQHKEEAERERLRIFLNEEITDAASPSASEITSGTELTQWVQTSPTFNWEESARQFEKALSGIYDSMTVSSDSAKYWFRLNKKVTSVTIITEPTEVDVTSFSESVKQVVPGSPEVRILDQDGDEVPDELAHRIKSMDWSDSGREEKLREILATWNDGDPEMKNAPLPGHRQGCQYLGTHHYACTCQPPTLFERELLWQCDCCGHPRADQQYGLCDVCEGHEYSDPKQAEFDHEALFET